MLMMRGEIAFAMKYVGVALGTKYMNCHLIETSSASEHFVSAESPCGPLVI